MGTDWYRMRLRPSARDADLPALIRQQATAFRASGSLWDDFGHLADGAGEPPSESDWREFPVLVQIDEGEGNYCRIAGFVLNPVFPAEWRLAACRSYLPAELPGQLLEWESHLGAVWDGGHQEYLHGWYCHETARGLAEEWQALRERAAAARDRRNSWAVRPELIKVREEVLAMALPRTPPAPVWRATPATVKPPGDDGDRRLAVATEWNRRVPAGQKVRISRIPDFGQYLASALTSPWHADCLAWIRQAAEQGYGLLLDW